MNHLKVLEAQYSPVAQSSIRLEVEKSNTWFTKRTLERFITENSISFLFLCAQPFFDIVIVSSTICLSDLFSLLVVQKL